METRPKLSLPKIHITRGVSGYEIPIQNENLSADRQEVVNEQSFERLFLLGRGAYAKVYLVRKLSGHDKGKLYAMKMLKKASLHVGYKTIEHTKSERSILEEVHSCPFIVKLHYAFQNSGQLFLIVDYHNGGEFFLHLVHLKRFSEEATRFYTAEVSIAVDFLHKLGIIYRDMKLENLLMGADGHVVLTDFGLSKEMPDQSARAYTQCGTTDYMAPEVLRPQEGYGFEVDWWSMGVLVYELLCGTPPFTDYAHPSNTKKNIINKEPVFNALFSDDARTLITGLLQKNVKRRLGSNGGLEEIKKQPFYASIDWDKLSRKELQPPIIPSIRDELDVSNFSESFTGQPTLDSPAIPTNTSFDNFSFILNKYHGKQPAANNNLANSLPHQQQSGGAEFTAPQFGFTRGGGGPMSPLPQQSMFSKFYTLGEKIGEGTFSMCYKCVHNVSKKEFAVKIVRKTLRQLNPRTEIEILQSLKHHKHIVQIETSMEDDKYVYIVLELLKGGELRCTKYPEAEAKTLMQIIFKTVHDLHRNRIIHRDLKPENFMFTSSEPGSDLKLIDFGFAKRMTDATLPLQTPIGSRNFVAPEVIQNFHSTPENYDESADIWSLGAIMYITLCGYPPYQSNDEMRDESSYRIFMRLLHQPLSFPEAEWADISADAKDLVSKLLTPNPAERISAMTALSHPWLDIPQLGLLSPAPMGSSSNFSNFNPFFEGRKLVLGQKLQNNSSLLQRRKQKQIAEGPIDSAFMYASAPPPPPLSPLPNMIEPVVASLAPAAPEPVIVTEGTTAATIVTTQEPPLHSLRPNLSITPLHAPPAMLVGDLPCVVETPAVNHTMNHKDTRNGKRHLSDDSADRDSDAKHFHAE